jgi:hypothetical protein
MTTLPFFQVQPSIQSLMQAFILLQNQWRSILNPVLAVPMLSGLQLNNVALKMGSNVINTTLQRQMQGWFITDIDAATTIYRSAPFNTLTLTLTASAACNVSLWVY